MSILIRIAGGLSTSFPSLKANLLLSSAVALTGIAIPMGLSFTLKGLVVASPLQCFAAGAALCSTSLGTTFTILSTSGLTNTRLGTVLTSAAMMDDVVGLVMVQVISNLGGSESSFRAVNVVRPVFVSIGFAIACPLFCYFLVVPTSVRLNHYREKSLDGKVHRYLVKQGTAFVLHTAILLAMVTGATYAGTSNLFAAYLAGAMISWWDTEIAHPVTNSSVEAQTSSEIRPCATGTGQENGGDPIRISEVVHLQSEIVRQDTTGVAVYHEHYSVVVDRILKPFFFVRRLACSFQTYRPVLTS